MREKDKFHGIESIIATVANFTTVQKESQKKRGKK